MDRSTAFLTAFATTLLLSGNALAADSIVAQTTFDSDLGGWTTNSPPDVQWNATGGNPGGEALFNDVTNGVGTIMIAPASFLSPAVNYTKLNGKAYISYQHLMVKETGVIGIGNYNIVMSGPGGTATFTGATAIVLPKKNPWVAVVAPLVEADWSMSSGGSWSALLANVTSIQIPMEMVSNSGGTDQEAMDNIKLVSHPSGFSPK